MALKRWAWAWVPVAAAALAAVLLLPGGGETRSLLSFLQGSPSSLRVLSHRDDVRRALEVQRGRLRDAERADSLIAAARGPRALTARDDALTTVVYETPLSAADARVWLDAAEKELARYPTAAGPGGRLLIALYSNPARSRATGFGLWYGTARRLPPDAATSPCVVELNLVPRGAGRQRRAPTPGSLGPFLGLCGLIRRFGMPAPGIARWISSAGWRAYAVADGGLMSMMLEAARPVPRITLSRPDLTNDRPWEWYYGTPWVAIGCLDGTWSLCARDVRIRPGDANSWWYSDPPQAQFVAYLLATGTPQQFAAFWRSPLPTADALRQAYGRPAGELAYRSLSHWYVTAQGGPHAGPELMLAGLFWAAAALVLALVVGRRWTTEI